MKKSKVTKLEQLPMKEGQKFPAFNIEFEDGTKGFTMSKFVLNEEMEYIVEELPTKKDPSKTYTRIKRPQADKPGGYKKDTLGTIIGTGASYSVTLYAMPPFKEGKIGDIMDVVINAMAAKHNEVSTDREKGFVSYAMKYAIDVYQNDDHREKFQKAKKQDGKSIEEELNLVVAIYQQILKNMLDVNKALS